MPKIVKMDTLFRGAKPRKTKASRTTQSGSQSTSRRTTRTFPFEPPPGLGVKPLQADVLEFIGQHPGQKYDTWPETFRLARLVERLHRDKLVRRKYYPTRYYLTREGSGLVSWIKRLRERCTINPAKV